MSIDKRKHYILMIDTETANTIQKDKELDMSNVLVYDCGWAVIDTKGNLYETASFVNKDIFLKEREMMKSAYYHKKIPLYAREIREGKRKLATTYEIKTAMLETIAKYNIKEVCAHNARFDSKALDITQKWVTKSAFRYWFPFNSVVWWDTMNMAQDVICQMSTYKDFCKQNNYLLPNGACRKTAEILYRFISGNNNFQESHTGLEDVLIESQILWYCFRQKKPMRKLLYEDQREFPTMTKFQKQIMSSLKKNPTINIKGCVL